MRFTALTLGVLSLAPMLAADDIEQVNKRIHESATVLSEILNAGDRSIPRDLIEKAHCVGVVPNLKRAGFIVGAKYGKGVVSCRIHDTGKWSAPSTIRIEGGSIGFQIGVGETDVVFIVNNQSGEDKLMKDKFTIGADASAMAGPVGRSAEAETDAMMRAEILGWSRSRGVFAGVALEGATLRPDNDDNRKIYGQDVTQREILHGRVPSPPSAAALYEILDRYPVRRGAGD
jgi:SH3 domain-containing YSC84-like protein 1